MKNVVRAWMPVIPCLGLIGWAGWMADPAWAQDARGERPAPRITLKPGGGSAAREAELPDGELLPALPPETADDPPRKRPAPVAVALPPDIPPLGLPSDGETAPSFPDLPDLPESSLLPQTPGHDGAGGSRPPGEESVPPFPSEGGPPPAGPETAPGVTPPPAAADAPFPIWHESPKKARALAQQEKRCMLLVFSSSQGEAGGASRQLSDEVFATPTFNEFALNHLVLCGLFYAPSSPLDLNVPAKIARLDALTAIKKAFKVRGFPCAILFGPDGKEINRWSGYVKGRSQWYAQQIKQAVDGHEAVLFATERRRAQLAAKGYRTWMSAQGTPLFARLLEYDAQSALFRDEAGADRKVRLKLLALPDREIITRQRLGKPMPERATAEASSTETTLR